MNGDALYQKIEQRLTGPLDWALFQDCANGLLRDWDPGLVPIRGGSDAGMDGAIADGKGKPFPLITTTSKQCTTNLHTSLRSYIAEGGDQREAVFATSRFLTPKRRRNLDQVASEIDSLW